MHAVSTYMGMMSAAGKRKSANDERKNRQVFGNWQRQASIHLTNVQPLWGGEGGDGDAKGFSQGDYVSNGQVTSTYEQMKSCDLCLGSHRSVVMEVRAATCTRMRDMMRHVRKRRTCLYEVAGQQVSSASRQSLDGVPHVFEAVHGLYTSGRLRSESPKDRA